LLSSGHVGATLRSVSRFTRSARVTSVDSHTTSRRLRARSLTSWDDATFGSRTARIFFRAPRLASLDSTREKKSKTVRATCVAFRKGLNAIHVVHRTTRLAARNFFSPHLTPFGSARKKYLHCESSFDVASTSCPMYVGHQLRPLRCDHSLLVNFVAEHLAVTTRLA
jgi:hypothetical protein